MFFSPSSILDLKVIFSIFSRSCFVGLVHGFYVITQLRGSWSRCTNNTISGCHSLISTPYRHPARMALSINKYYKYAPHSSTWVKLRFVRLCGFCNLRRTRRQRARDKNYSLLGIFSSFSCWNLWFVPLCDSYFPSSMFRFPPLFGSFSSSLYLVITISRIPALTIPSESVSQDFWSWFILTPFPSSWFSSSNFFRCFRYPYLHFPSPHFSSRLSVRSPS